MAFYTLCPEYKSKTASLATIIKTQKILPPKLSWLFSKSLYRQRHLKLTLPFMNNLKK
jgi:hypothetical protein